MSAPTPSKRVVSLDAARAIVVALMIFMDHPTIIRSLPWFLVHPHWNGFRPADFVFPAFVFIAGVSMAFSARKVTAETWRPATLTFAKRIAVLFLIGLGLNLAKYGLPLLSQGWLAPLANLRVMGVLQRIALGCLAAWPFVRRDARWPLAAAGVLLAAHAAVLLLAGAPGVTPGAWVAQVAPEQVLAVKQASIAGWLDRTLLGVAHTYQGTGFDPEGLLGVLSTAAQAMLGLALGKVLLRDGGTGREMPRMLAWGVAGVLVAIALAPALPINKYLWTPTFVLVSSGAATLMLALMYRWIDLGQRTAHYEWLVPMGRNALLLYIGSNLFVVALRMVPMPSPTGVTWYAFPGIGLWLAEIMPAALASVLFAAAEVAMWVWVGKLLYDRKWFFKI